MTVDDRQPGVAHDVARVDPLLGQALGPGGPDVVLVGDVEDRGPRDPGDDRERDRAEGDGRQDEVRGSRRRTAWPVRVSSESIRTKLVWISRSDPRVDPAAARAASASWTAKMYWSVSPSTKTGMLIAEQRDDGDDAVRPALGVPGRPAAERDPDADREDHRARRSARWWPGSAKGVPRATGWLLMTLLPRSPWSRLSTGRAGTAARAACRGPCELAHRRDAAPAWRAGRGCDAAGSPGQQVDEREQEDRQPEQDRDRAEEAADDVLQHLAGRLVPG